MEGEQGIADAWADEKARRQQAIEGLREEFQDALWPIDEAKRIIDNRYHGSSDDIDKSHTDMVTATGKVIPALIQEGLNSPGEIHAFLEEVVEVSPEVTREALSNLLYVGEVRLTSDRIFQLSEDSFAG